MGTNLNQAPVDVLAVLTQAIADSEVTNRRYAESLREARAAVAELIEAGERYRKAIAARDADTYGARKVYEEADIAQAVFDAALARVQGEQK